MWRRSTRTSKASTGCTATSRCSPSANSAPGSNGRPPWDAPEPDAILALAEAYRGYVVRYPGRYEVLVRYHHPADDEEFQANAQYVAEPIRASLRSFGLGPAEVSSALQVFGASIRGLCLNESVGFHGDKRQGPEHTLRQFVALFTTGLAGGAWPVAKDTDPAD
ncbi:TetR-like C-terminal domain-containing protein [Yinghuangia aomiensis]